MALKLPPTMSELTDSEFEQQTFEVIAREFGPSGLVRFFTAFQRSHCDCDSKGWDWKDMLTMDEILVKAAKLYDR